MTVTNLGSVAVGGVAVTGTVPSQLSLQTATPSAGTCDVATASCALGTLAAGASAEITATLRGEAEGTGDFSARVTGQVTDTDDTNNTASSSLTINAATVDAPGGDAPASGDTPADASGGCSLIR